MNIRSGIQEDGTLVIDDRDRKDAVARSRELLEKARAERTEKARAEEAREPATATP